ncbi:D-alanine--D-alanine ligase [Parabacteroides sp. AF48-14]|uniref:D-alanine--D-alanine ligase n=1 Tax=Parabacteroides sp. AF48-14 TaxID=2292052 RepID=UPI000EFF4706|nr:D-alanine--D-alanine ligase [Parabacteroides sp. AF48-14]RHO66370.1 D-alanine--D-alanine ligase [Parabacteroides sp. AF48-14]
MNTTVAIIFGGKSAEHKVSLKSATNIFNAIDRTKFTPLLIGIDKAGNWFYNTGYETENIDLANHDYFTDATPVYLSHSANDSIHVVSLEANTILTGFHLAFPIIHGTNGEDGTLQGLLKSMNIPFVGPDVLGSAIAMDKDVAKRLLKAFGIPVANSYTLYRHKPLEHSFTEITSTLGLPLFIKPANAGSSVGVSKVTDENEFKAALSTAFQYDNKILIEEAIIGKEIECAVLGNEQLRASVVGEIVATKDFYSYDAKYISSSGARLQIPAEIDEALSNEIRECAIKACETICCEGMSRVDFFLTKDNKFVLNEINTLPGFTEISMYPKLWEQTGISYTNLITELISLAQQRHSRDCSLSIEM